MLKIATWNVNSLRIRLPHVLEWWNQNQPDILCLQETKVEDAYFPHEAFKQLGLHVAAHGQKTYNGVAIISKHPMQHVTPGFNGHNLEEQSRLLSATVQGIRVISAYVPNGESLTSVKFQFKTHFYRHLTAHIRSELQTHPNLVLCGDFNIAADERDVANPERAAKEVMFTPEERQWLKELQSATGLADALRLTDQTEHIFSWWDYRTFARSQTNGMRIDYLFVSPPLQAKTRGVQHFAEERQKPQPSDHIPVMVDLDL